MKNTYKLEIKLRPEEDVRIVDSLVEGKHEIIFKNALNGYKGSSLVELDVASIQEALDIFRFEASSEFKLYLREV